MENQTPRLLINLPPTFFTHPMLKLHFARLESLAEVRKTSHNTAEEIMTDLAWAQAVIMWAWPSLTDEMLAKAGELNFVGQINTTQTTVKACFNKGIAISETRHCWSPAVAEMALALILSGLRQVSAYHIAMRSGKEAWVNDFPADINPLERELSGAAVGIVGFGAIGQRLSELLEPFNVDLRIYDPFLPDEVASRFNARPVQLLELIKQSDVVVLCAANQPDAEHLVGKAEIAALRKNAVLVNVGRSMLVDMAALQKRLTKGNLVAMLDVFDTEPLEGDSPLRSLPNTYLTPHRGGGLMSSVMRALEMLADDYEAHLESRERHYKVTERMLTSFPA